MKVVNVIFEEIGSEKEDIVFLSLNDSVKNISYFNIKELYFDLNEENCGKLYI